MTWRRFIALLKGLSPNSAYVNALWQERREAREMITDPEAGERYVASMLR